MQRVMASTRRLKNTSETSHESPPEAGVWNTKMTDDPRTGPLIRRDLDKPGWSSCSWDWRCNLWCVQEVPVGASYQWNTLRQVWLCWVCHSLRNWGIETPGHDHVTLTPVSDSGARCLLPQRHDEWRSRRCRHLPQERRIPDVGHL